MNCFHTFKIRSGSCFIYWMLGGMLMLAPACGYRFSGGGALPGGAERLSLGIMENRSTETGVEGMLLNDIGMELTRHGKTFSYGEETADAILAGEVVSVSALPVTRQSLHTVLERQVTVTISLTISDKTGTVIWQEADLSDSEAYAVTSDKGATEQNRQSALSKISKRLAEKAFYRMTDNF